MPTLALPRPPGAPVLIFHPHSETATLLQGLVRQAGHTPYVADSIGTAFAYADQRNPLAMAMICVGRTPHCTGLVWARTVRQTHPFVPIVVLASDTLCPGDESVTEYLPMPFQQTSCLTLLKRYLH